MAKKKREENIVSIYIKAKGIERAESIRKDLREELTWHSYCTQTGCRSFEPEVEIRNTPHFKTDTMFMEVRYNENRACCLMFKMDFKKKIEKLKAEIEAFIP